MARRQYQGIFAYVAQRNFSQLGKRMPRRGDEHWIKSDDRFECNVWGCVPNRTDAKIHQPVAQLLQALLACDVVQCERDSRMLG